MPDSKSKPVLLTLIRKIRAHLDSPTTSDDENSEVESECISLVPGVPEWKQCGSYSALVRMKVDENAVEAAKSVSEKLSQLLIKNETTVPTFKKWRASIGV